MARAIANVYGDALYDVGLDNNNLKEMNEYAKDLYYTFLENENLTNMLTNPRISKDEKKQIIKSVFDKRIPMYYLDFFELLIDKERIEFSADILLYLHKKINEYFHIGAAYVTTSIELDEKMKSKIKIRLMEITKYVEFDIHYYVDEDLIGGMIIRIGDRIVDTSIRSKINEISSRLYGLQLGIEE